MSYIKETINVDWNLKKKEDEHLKEVFINRNSELQWKQK